MSLQSKVTLVFSMCLLVSVSMLLPSVAHASDQQWIKDPRNPVLTPTLDGWDSDHTVSPRVLYDGKVYRMWYNGGNSAGITGIGYASSTDGITWTKYGGRILAPGPSGAWDSGVVVLGSVAWNGTQFLMWYGGSNTTTFDRGAVGWATSKDGISWIKYAGNPVMKPTEIDQGYLASPYVVRFESTYNYNMWYTGRNETHPKGTPLTRILFASSFDGVHWNKWPSPVLSPSTDPKAWDSAAVYSPSVFYNGTTFGLWYSGLDQTLLSQQIGYATSPDGSTWTKSSANPILNPGPPGSWDSAGVEQPSAVLVGNVFMLYYDGLSSNAGGRIGLARSPQGFAIPEFPVPALNLLLSVLGCAAIFFTQHHKRPRV